MLFKTTIIMAAAAIGASALTQDAAELLLRDRFAAWKAQFNKVYESNDVEEMRFQAFIQNVERVADLKAQAEATNDTAEFGLTKFADMSAEEFKATMLTHRTSVDGPAALPLVQSNNLRATPSSFDWRSSNKVTPVKNQGSCGSCWAHGAVETIESQWAIAGHPLTEFSVQQVVSCDTYDSGCRGGDSPTAYKYITGAGGLATATAYPYTSGNGISGSCKSFTVAGGKISGFNYATPSCTRSCGSQDEATLAKNVAAVGAPSICIDASQLQLYTSGVLTPTSGKGCSSSYADLDHCIQLIGFANIDTSNGYWIVRNSWDVDWGVAGYFYLKYGTNTCGVADEATLPVLA